MTDDKRTIGVTQKSGTGSSGDQSVSLTINENYKGKAFEKLVTAHETQISFNPDHLKEIIVAIDEGIQSIDNSPLDFSAGIDINKKNELNQHCQQYFEDFVEVDFYPQFHRIDSFLQLKVNQDTLQPRVDRVIKSLNRKIRAFQGGMSFEAILLKIADALIDTHSEALSEKEQEILLVLYYFYTNCCIGTKTHGE